jgi:hypothetical protein
MIEGQSHSKARTQSTLLNKRQSLTELAAICTTAGECGELMCQPHGLIPTHWNQPQKLKHWYYNGFF